MRERERERGRERGREATFAILRRDSAVWKSSFYSNVYDTYTQTLLAGGGWVGRVEGGELKKEGVILAGVCRTTAKQAHWVEEG